MKSISLVCDVCDKKCSTKGNLKIHKSLHTGKKPFSCKICNRKFAVKEYLDCHMLVHTYNKTGDYECIICRIHFRKKEEVITHHKRCHLKIKNVFCHIYKQGIFDKHSLENPLKSKLTHSVKCQACNERFVNRKALAKHFQQHGEKPFLCNICRKEFSGKNNLVAHQKRLHGSKTCVCKLCGKSFPSRYDQMNHDPCSAKNNLVLDSNVKKYKCKLCNNNLYTSRCAFIDHQKRRHPNSINNANDDDSDSQISEKKFTCSICYEKFSRNSSLTRHYLKHGEEKTYVCKLCSASFSQQHSLTEHEELVHFHNEFYSCKYCNDKFSSESNIIDHFKSKHEEVLSKKSDSSLNKITLKEHYTLRDGLSLCLVCDKYFSSEYILNKHKSFHISKICNICSREFKTAHAVIIHYKLGHKNYKYECNVCRNHFELKTTLEEHNLLHPYGSTDFLRRQLPWRKNRKVSSDKKTIESIDCFIKDNSNDSYSVNMSKNKIDDKKIQFNNNSFKDQSTPKKKQKCSILRKTTCDRNNINSNFLIIESEDLDLKNSGSPVKSISFNTNKSRKCLVRKIKKYTKVENKKTAALSQKNSVKNLKSMNDNKSEYEYAINTEKGSSKSKVIPKYKPTVLLKECDTSLKEVEIKTEETSFLEKELVNSVGINCDKDNLIKNLTNKIELTRAKFNQTKSSKLFSNNSLIENFVKSSPQTCSNKKRKNIEDHDSEYENDIEAASFKSELSRSCEIDSKSNQAISLKESTISLKEIKTEKTLFLEKEEVNSFSINCDKDNLVKNLTNKIEPTRAKINQKKISKLFSNKSLKDIFDKSSPQKCSNKKRENIRDNGFEYENDFKVSMESRPINGDKDTLIKKLPEENKAPKNDIRAFYKSIWNNSAKEPHDKYLLEKSSNNKLKNIENFEEVSLKPVLKECKISSEYSSVSSLNESNLSFQERITDDVSFLKNTPKKFSNPSDSKICIKCIKAFKRSNDDTNLTLFQCKNCVAHDNSLMEPYEDTSINIPNKTNFKKSISDLLNLTENK